MFNGRRGLVVSPLLYFLCSIRMFENVFLGQPNIPS